MRPDPWADAGDDDAAQVELNLTPLVDVVFALLVVFMIAAGAISEAAAPEDAAGEIELSLPAGVGVGQPTTAGELVVAVDVDGSLYQDGAPTDAKALAQAVLQRVASQPNLQVRIEADQKLTYQRVMDVIAELQRLGVRNVGLATRNAAGPAAAPAGGAAPATP